MKYKAIIETDEFEDFEFYEDGNGKYMVGKDAGATASGGWMPLYFTECEQQSVLNKIRAEIEQIEINGHIRDVECFRAGINVALNVIDKYIERE